MLKHDKTLKKLFSYTKVHKEILTSQDIEIEKKNFYRYKSPVPLRDIDIE